MNWLAWVGFYKDETGRLSSTRLTVITGCFTSSAIVAYLAYDGTLTEALFGLYLAYCGGVYGMMKFSDNSVTKASINSTATQAPINVENIENAEKLTGTGNVNVSSK